VVNLPNLFKWPGVSRDMTETLLYQRVKEVEPESAKDLIVFSDQYQGSILANMYTDAPEYGTSA